MDVLTEGVQAQCDELYSMQELTGLRFCVHAVLITQSLTANVLLRSCEQIEYYDLEEFGFMSSCATVTAESLGHAMLLIMLKYPLAKIRLSTPQTIAEARSLGMICE